jgi:hypothetical protein
MSGNAPLVCAHSAQNRVDKCRNASYANASAVEFHLIATRRRELLILLLPETFLHFALLFRESRFGLSHFGGNFKLKFSCQNKFLSLLGGNRI